MHELVFAIVILLLLIFGVIISKKEKEAKKRAEEEELERIQRELEAKKRAKQAKEDERKKKIERYFNSPFVNGVVSEFAKNGTPCKIIIHYSSIEAFYYEHKIEFIYSKYGIEDFEKPYMFNRKPQSSDMFLLGCVINQKFNSIYSVKECTKVVQINHRDEVEYGEDLQCVELTRPLQSL